ncbi:hypothetical protein AM228_06450 [Planktothricoides sp. SR001]|nr:hypothetical protein AM228_06450 [Planktothricoides sp. SR001]
MGTADIKFLHQARNSTPDSRFSPVDPAGVISGISAQPGLLSVNSYQPLIKHQGILYKYCMIWGWGKFLRNFVGTSKGDK